MFSNLLKNGGIRPKGPIPLGTLSKYQNPPYLGLTSFQEACEAEEQRAEQLLNAELRSAVELTKRRKGDKLKIELAARLRRETTLGWRWIASRLHMGHWRRAADAVCSINK